MIGCVQQKKQLSKPLCAERSQWACSSRQSS